VGSIFKKEGNMTQVYFLLLTMKGTGEKQGAVILLNTRGKEKKLPSLELCKLNTIADKGFRQERPYISVTVTVEFAGHFSFCSWTAQLLSPF
jgi:hypothetical protein